jgi:DNA-binding response OmpR family regulator
LGTAVVRRRRRHERDTGSGHAAHVLVVNDDDGAAELLVRLLTRAGYDVERATDQLDARARLIATVPDVAVLDLGGGVGTSLKLLDSIRSHTDPGVANLRVVLLANQASNRMFSWQSGVDAFLVRPFHADDLLRDVAQVLDRNEEERTRHRRARLAEARTDGRTIEPRPWETQSF